MKTDWDVAVLKALPTRFQGQCCDCKVNANGVRVWLCRVGGGVSIEQYQRDGGWHKVSGGCEHEIPEELL